MRSSKPFEYVCGFAFSPDHKDVVLIKKAKPEWQAGRWNGVGGKVEPHEVVSQSMVREFREETGVTLYDWRHFATLTATATGHVIHFFETTSSAIYACGSPTREKVKVHEVARIRFEKLVSSCSWLIPLATDDNKVITYSFTSRNPVTKQHP